MLRAVRRLVGRKVERVLRAMPPEAVRAARSDCELRAAAEAFLRPRFRRCAAVWGRFNLDWHVAYSLANGIRSPHYLPQDVFYGWLEPRLNPNHQRLVLDDKNFYSIYPFGGRTPEVVARVVDGRLMTPDYTPVPKEELVKLVRAERGPLVLKPSLDSAGGNGVMIDEPEAIATALDTRVSARRSQPRPLNLVIQRKLEQSPAMAALNPSSINTVRVLTVRTQSGVRVVSAVIRMGRAGSAVDNFGRGGLVVGVKPDDTLMPRAYTKDYRSTECHPDSGVRFAEHTVPGFWKSVSECIGFHASLPHMDAVSWDVALAPDGRARVIELNLRWVDISLHQLPRGPLLPVELLDEVLEHVAAKAVVPRHLLLRSYVGTA